MERAARMADLIYQAVGFRVHLSADAPPQLYNAIGRLYGVDAGDLRGSAVFECQVVVRKEEKIDGRIVTTFMVNEVRSMRVGERYLGDAPHKDAELFFDLSWLVRMEEAAKQAAVPAVVPAAEAAVVPYAEAAAPAAEAAAPAAEATAPSKEQVGEKASPATHEKAVPANEAELKTEVELEVGREPPPRA